uniref:CHK kinase-like domain-containing protein n=1 Tax=Stomoxys calcitrans TaxID=35570 RepID=A0A1I8Q303_STOCA
MSTYNDDELEAPAWIDQRFLEEVLSTYENNEHVEVLNYEMSPASMKGDHYASIMFRCKVEYRFGDNGTILNKSLIIKTLPVEEGSKKREMLLESRLFETEIKMFSEVLPKIEKILAECGEPTRLSAGFIYQSLKPHKVIIVEDLCTLGYDTVRGRYLNEEEIKMLYGKLAKLHAVSHMLGHSEDHECVTELQDGYKLFSLTVMEEIWTHGIEHFLNMLSSHEEFSIYYQKVKDMKDSIRPTMVDLYRAFTLKQGKGDIFVLNHGDFHLKNLMFKFNHQQQMEDVIMVDYQLSTYAPANVDLMYSEYLLLGPEMRSKRNEIRQYYFTEFIRILKKINYQGRLPKYSELQISALQYRQFSVYLLGVLLPLIIGYFRKSAEELNDVDTVELTENRELNTPFYYAPDFVDEVRRVMPKLLYEGFLD